MADKKFLHKHERETGRIPDAATELRLEALHDQAMRTGKIEAPGIRPMGSPMPSSQTGYYSIPMMKEPQWSWEVPLYFFVGGAAGAAALIAQIAKITGSDPQLVSDARTIAAMGGLLSPALLISDLGMPSRFLNMLRVFKVQSAMSVGVYIVTGFTNSVIAAKLAELLGKKYHALPIRIIEEASGAAAALLGLGMASYTGVLIGATAIAVWNRNISTLPVHFAMSGLNSAVSALELMGHHESRALSMLGIAACLAETAEGAKLESNHEDFNDPLKKGLSGAIVRAGGVLSGPLPLVLRIIAAFASNRNARKLRRAAAISSLAGSFLTRVGWVRAGHASARDYRIPLQLAPSQQALPDKSQPDYGNLINRSAKTIFN